MFIQSDSDSFFNRELWFWLKYADAKSAYVSQILKMLNSLDIKIPFKQFILSEEYQKAKKTKNKNKIPYHH